MSFLFKRVRQHYYYPIHDGTVITLFRPALSGTVPCPAAFKVISYYTENFTVNTPRYHQQYSHATMDITITLKNGE